MPPYSHVVLASYKKLIINEEYIELMLMRWTYESKSIIYN